MEIINRKIAKLSDIIKVYEEKEKAASKEGVLDLVIKANNSYCDYSIFLDLKKGKKEKIVTEKEFQELYLVYEKEKKKKKDKTSDRKYNINHIIISDAYYRVFTIRNFKDIDISSFIDNDSYFIVKMKKSKNKESIVSQIESSSNFDKNNKLEFLKGINEDTEYSFDIYYFLKANTYDELESKTFDCKKAFAKFGVEIKIKTHINENFFSKLLQRKDGYKNICFNCNNKLEIINFTSYKDPQNNSTQSLFNINIKESGIMEYDGMFYDMVEIEDIDYINAKETDKFDIIDNYKSVINSMTNQIKLQILIQNDLLDERKVEAELYATSDLPLNNNYNDYLRENIELSKENSAIKRIFFVITADKDKFVEEKKATSEIEKNLSFIKRTLKQIKANVIELSIEEKVKIYKGFFDYDFEGISRYIPYDSKRELVRDYISPSGIRFNFFSSQIGRNFISSFSIKNFPNAMRDEFLADIMKLPFKFNLSLRVEFEELDKTIDKINKKIFSMESTIIEKKKRKNAYIGHEFKTTYEESLALREELTSNDKKMFSIHISISLLDETEKGLSEKYQIVDSTIRRHLFRTNRLFLHQEKGMISTSPLPYDTPNHMKRNLLSENVAMLKPFYVKNHYDSDGIFYGLSEDNNLISIDRRKYANSSGWFLGVPGSGKSFLAKKEMTSVILRYPDEEVFIIDPESEYGILAKQYGGENIKISANSSVRINPFDITTDINELTLEGDENPIKIKQEFILSFIEVLAEGLTQAEKSVVDNILGKMYAEFVENVKNGVIKQPTLKTFYERLYYEPEKVAMGLALRIQIYVSGSLDLFSGETNVETVQRIVNFNIKDLGGQLKNVALMIILELLWNRINKNRALKKRTWIYIDEIYLLFENEASAKFLFAFYKRVRKYGGVPTGITQNVEDLLRSETARTMLSNAAFLCILRQSPNDRELLQDLFDLSDAQANYTKNNPPGTGIILAEGNVIHFKDKMNEKSELYKMMTTKIDD